MTQAEKSQLAREIFLMRLASLPPGEGLQQHRQQIDDEAELAAYAVESLAISLDVYGERSDAGGE
jgi:hypothetical protein